VTASKIRKVVFAPDLIGAAFIDLHSRRVLERWRDGQLTPVTNRDLLSEQLRLLRKLGLSPELLKRWAYWLASPEKNLFIETALPSTNSLSDLCEVIANASAAEAIIVWNQVASRQRTPRWTRAESFLASR
jgi:hypothetical protein